MKLTDHISSKIEERKSMIKEGFRLELRNPAAWAEQFINLVFGCAALLGWSVLATGSLLVALALMFFMSVEMTTYSIPELKQGLASAVPATAILAFSCFLVGNVGKFRNVFLHRATYQVDSRLALQERYESQVNTTEVLLVRYGLISHDDVTRMRADKSTEQSPSAF